jgi:hypothetical protein
MYKAAIYAIIMLLAILIFLAANYAIIMLLAILYFPVSGGRPVRPGIDGIVDILQAHISLRFPVDFAFRVSENTTKNVDIVRMMSSIHAGAFAGRHHLIPHSALVSKPCHPVAPARHYM